MSPVTQSHLGAATALFKERAAPKRLSGENRLIARMCEKEDIKEVYAEMKANGFDTKAVRTIVRLRKKEEAERQEEEAMIDLYKAALGMQ